LQLLIGSRPIDQEKERQALLATRWRGLLSALEQRAANAPLGICLRVHEISSQPNSQSAASKDEAVGDDGKSEEEIEDEEESQEAAEGGDGKSEEDDGKSEDEEEEEGGDDGMEPADWEEKVTVAVQARLAKRFHEDVDHMEKHRVGNGERSHITLLCSVRISHSTHASMGYVRKGGCRTRFID
jgi:hypothetical protein